MAIGRSSMFVLQIIKEIIGNSAPLQENPGKFRRALKNLVLSKAF